MTSTQSANTVRGDVDTPGAHRQKILAGFAFVVVALIFLAGSLIPLQAVADRLDTDDARAIAGMRLAEPLVRTAPTTPAEDAALARALSAYRTRASATDYGFLEGYVAQYPHSGWTPALLTNLGLAYLHDGYYSRAIAAWRQAWALGKGAGDPHAKAVVDRAVGELARLYASLGQFDQIAALFDEIGARPISGSATEAVQSAREELVLVKKDPRHLFNCGPIALKLVMLALDPRDQKGASLQWYRAGSNGTNLAELDGLAAKAGASYWVIFRSPGEAVPMPAIVHWKVGHFAAIVGRDNGRYHIEEPGFPGQVLWVTPAALDAEASGYFLVPASVSTAPGWRTVDASEAANVWGKGPTNGVQPGDANDPTAHGGRGGRSRGGPGGPGNGNNPNNCGMCGYDIKEATVGVTLSDTPVGYAPPLGPAPLVTITYNQREDSQPANFSFYNVSPKWTLSWLTYVIDDPTNPGANVSRYLSGGGATYYSGYSSGTGQFAAQQDDGSILVLVSTNPITYHRQLADGTVEVYAQSNGAATYPRNVFLSQVIDPQGNAATLHYDSQMRLTSLTDAAGRQTTLTYGLTGSPLLITQITDPFGRFATLAYDTSGRLSSITDVLGLTSSFAYDANSLVDSMTTPYGTTHFAYTAPGRAGPPRFVDATDALGHHEREEWLEPASTPDSDPAATVPTGMPLTPTNQYLSYRDSFYWDKNAYPVARCTPTGGCDYTKARDTHFTHVPNESIKSTTIESVKYPLENRIWYQYPGQTNSIYAGTFQQPIALGRVLDGGQTKLSQVAYDTAGYFKPTRTTDPIGRVTTFNYAANHIDLVSITQMTASGVQATLDQFTYNGQHRPLTHVDAADETTTYSYNSAGQLTSVTNALNQKTTYAYNGTGDLISITNANNLTQASYTYDAFDRVVTFTDSEGWSVTYAYDAFDRITSVTYPDNTTETYTYNKLDLASYKDRLGRTWAYDYDADRRRTSTTDPSHHQTLFAYNYIDELTVLTDPNNHVTEWGYDVEGRVTAKIYADNSGLTFGYESTTSRLKVIADTMFQSRLFHYALDDQLTGVLYTAVNPTPNVLLRYDPYFPRLTSKIDGSGTTSYTYVPVGSPGALQMQQETTPLTNGTIIYAYDVLGRLASRTVGGQDTESFGYDSIGRFTSDVGDLGSFTLAYLGQTSQITSRQLANSTLATSWSYLANSSDRRLASLGTTGMVTGQNTSFALTTNAVSEITGSAQTSETTVASPTSASSQSATYNNLNQLTNLSGQAFTFDADGNLTSDGARNYKWDEENRLVAIAYIGQSGKATTFAYDGLGRRVQQVSTPIGGQNPVTTNYLWCGPRLCQARNSTNTVIRSYYAEGEFKPGSPNVSYYYAPDQIGSIRRAFSTSAAPSYDYDAYGKALQTTTAVTDFGYAGMVLNADSGLYLTTRRPYDPTTGRFLTRDPIGEVGDPLANLYAYVGGDPAGGRDPQGLVGPWNAPPVTVNIPTLPAGYDYQIGGGGSGAAIGPAGGVSASATGAISFNPSDMADASLVGQVQVAGGVGTGFYAQAGPSGFVGVAKSPQSGFSSNASAYAETDVGVPAASASGSATFDDCLKLSGGSASAGGRIGAGPGGAGGFFGAQGSGSYAVKISDFIKFIVPPLPIR